MWSRLWLTLVGCSLLIVACHAPTPGAATPATNHGAATTLRFVPSVGHSGVVFAMAFSPDGRLLASASADKTLRLWDTEEGGLLAILELSEEARSVAWSPDGTRVAVGTDSSSVVLFDVVSQKKLWTAAMHLETGIKQAPLHEVWGVAITKEGDVLSVATDATLRRHSAADGSVIKAFPHTIQWTSSVAFSKDLSKVAAGGKTNVEVWSTKDGALLSKASLEDTINGIAFADNDAALVAGMMGHTHYAIDASSGAVIQSFRSADDCSAIAGAPNDAIVAIGCSGGDLGLFDVHTGKKAHRVIPDWNGSCFSVAFSRDGSRVAEFHNDRLTVYSRATWNIIFQNKGAGYSAVTTAFARDNARGVIIADKSIYAVDLTSLRFLGAETTPLGLESPSIAGNGSMAIAVASDQSTDGALLVYDLNERHAERAFNELRTKEFGTAHDFGASGVEISATAIDGAGQLALVGLQSSTISTTPRTGGFAVLDLPTRKVRVTLKVSGLPTAIAISADGTKAFVGTQNGGVEVWDITKKKRIAFRQAHKLASAVTEVQVAPDGKTLMSRTTNALSIDDLVNPEKSVLVPLPENDRLVAAAFDPQGTFHVALASGNVGTLVGGQIQTSRALGEAVRTSGAFTGDARYLVSASKSGTLNVSRVDNGMTMDLLVRDGEWLAHTPSGWFDASKGGLVLGSAVDGLHAHRLNQLALKFGRPDKLFEEMGFGPPDLIGAFRARHDAIVAHAGTTAAAIDSTSSPVVTITKIDKKSEAAVEVTVDAEDPSGAARGRLLVRVNDVPIGDPNGSAITLPAKGVMARLALASGLNRIEVSVRDEAGVESLRQVRIVESTDKTDGALLFVGIGVSRYKKSELNLDYADADATSLGGMFEQQRKGFASARSVVLTNDGATRAKILSLKDELAKATVNDTVVLFFAGHGVYWHDDFYFAPYDVEPTPQSIATTGVSYREIEGLFGSSHARRRLILVDACHSGEEGATARVVPGAPSRGARGLEFETAPQSPTTAPTARTAAAPPSGSSLGIAAERDRERFLFSDLASSTGAVAFTASRGDETSRELASEKHGVFTAAWLAALTGQADVNRDGETTTSELRDFVAAFVARRTDDAQHPATDREVAGQQLVFTTGNTAALGPRLDPVTGFTIDTSDWNEGSDE